MLTKPRFTVPGTGDVFSAAGRTVSVTGQPACVFWDEKQLPRSTYVSYVAVCVEETDGLGKVRKGVPRGPTLSAMNWKMCVHPLLLIPQSTKAATPLITRPLPKAQPYLCQMTRQADSLSLPTCDIRKELVR